MTIILESSGLPHVSDRISSLLKGLAPADQKLNALFARRRDGFQRAKPDAVEGSKVFDKDMRHSSPTGRQGSQGRAPARRHRQPGGRPAVGSTSSTPNRNVDQTFRVTNLALKSGQIVSGLLLREEGEVLILADGPQGKEVRVPKSTVEERMTAPLSPMPANLVDQIAEDDFYRLLAFLLSKHEPTNAPPSGTGSKLDRP